jgi:hypothetical protein
MAKRPSPPVETLIGPTVYRGLLGDIAALLEDARRSSARAVNSIITATYWEIGRRIVTVDQGGEGRAEYGQELLKRLSVDLTARFGRGFSRANLEYMRRFHQYWPIPQTASGKLGTVDIMTAGRI